MILKKKYETMIAILPKGKTRNFFGFKYFLKILGCVIFLAGLSGCASQFSQHGHLLTEADLAQVQHGMSKQQVKFLLGTPDTTATYTGDVFYYISTKMEQKAFLKPAVVDRRVVAVYFNKQIDTVNRVAHYGLQDGKVFDFISRETPSHGQDASLLYQIFRNIGKNQNVFKGENKSGDIPDI